MANNALMDEENVFGSGVSLNGNEDDVLLWLDIETAGLEEKADVLEVGWLFTGWDMIPDWDAFHQHVITHTSAPVELFAPHYENGLVEAIMDNGPESTDGLYDVLTVLRHQISALANAGHRVLIAGKSVRFDYEALNGIEPSTFTDIHHHLIDISVIGELLDEWRPEFNGLVSWPGTDHRVKTCLEGTLETAGEIRDLFANMNLEQITVNKGDAYDIQ